MIKVCTCARAYILPNRRQEFNPLGDSEIGREARETAARIYVKANLDLPTRTVSLDEYPFSTESNVKKEEKKGKKET